MLLEIGHGQWRCGRCCFAASASTITNRIVGAAALDTGDDHIARLASQADSSKATSVHEESVGSQES